MAEAATRFLVSLPPEKKEVSQQEVNQFVRWYGGERSVAELTPPGIANYAEQLSLSDTDYKRKLERLRAFLLYTKEEGWTKDNLAVHLKAKAKKSKTSSGALSHRNPPKAICLTQQGYDELEIELAELKEQRLQAIDEVRRAAEDKDFRENSPLDAAKEQRSYLEGQVREIEETLKLATIINSEKTNPKVSVGAKVTLGDLASGEELSYTLVSSKEIDPDRGRISDASPIGKAIMGQNQGEVVEITTPAGKLHYRIKQIRH